MKTAVKILGVIPLMALFLDYAVAMQKVEPMGTRRCLRTFAKQTAVGTFPTLKINWELGVKWADQTPV